MANFFSKFENFEFRVHNFPENWDFRILVVLFSEVVEFLMNLEYDLSQKREFAIVASNFAKIA